MRWNLRWVAANAEIWRPADLLQACRAAGYSPSLSKVASWWNGTPSSVRLDELDMICTALNCKVADLLEAEPPSS
ncbi:helix-turn-helix domain-containing protein [Cryptosporangium sp. NPDC048952]|uniref:helix-turn-helix domain-containing protein n=1 Tax=Cryptosporangium sp. NPDC048952 TaxID=3363961 RepID=UPI00371C02E1